MPNNISPVWIPPLPRTGHARPPLRRAGATALSDALREAVVNLTAPLPMKERQQRFLELFCHVTGSEACVLLRYADGKLSYVAGRGLSSNAQARTFDAARQARFMATLDSRLPVHFPPDDPRPDPYLGRLLAEEAGHYGIGCSLYNEDALFGVLYAAMAAPAAYDPAEDAVIQTFAAIATVMLRHEFYIGALENLARHRGLVAAELVQEALQRSYPLLGRSSATLALLREIDVVARSDLSVLLTGETGVGKEVVARIIHSRSLRADQPLVYVNCAALPEALAESELFGHVRGAFSGASADRAGKFELANGGTLLLDEIGELPLAIQAKLLRAVQFGEIQRIGSDRSHHTDVRLIAATNRRLDEEVRAGRFRADLYHRLSMYPLHVPPLRARTGDVAILAEHFLEQARVRLGLRRVAMAGTTVAQLDAYDWPGNIRELEHVILRSTLRAAAQRGDTLVLECSDLDIPGTPLPVEQPERSARPLPETALPQAVDAFQRRLILTTLEACAGNWSEAARRLGLDRGNLHRLAKRLRLK